MLDELSTGGRSESSRESGTWPGYPSGRVLYTVLIKLLQHAAGVGRCMLGVPGQGVATNTVSVFDQYNVYPMQEGRQASVM